ncbi:MAG: hypothetical protein OEV48_20155, partial [Acidobacteriota bacterium]|nr:hypothetical protein [Acidobacteriota bacterium]
FLALPLLFHFIYYQMRSPWTASSLFLILMSLVLQQVVMMLRGFFKLGLWGAEVAAYRGLEEPEFCRPRAKTASIGEAVEV